MVHIMNKKSGTLKKVRSKANADEYYTYSHWPTKEIEGEVFIAVIKRPDPYSDKVLWIKKDSVNFVK